MLEALRCGACGDLLKNSSAAQLADALNQRMQGGIYVSPPVEVMTMFTEDPSRLPPKNPLDHLSSREFQVFSLLVDGIRANEIAARLALSPKPVDTYRSSRMRKLEIYDVAGLVKFAIHQQIALLSSVWGSQQKRVWVRAVKMTIREFSFFAAYNRA